MISSKRRTLTVDDLLRKQEESRKKRKQSPVVQRGRGEDNSPSEDDDFDLGSEGWEVEKDGGEWESEVDGGTGYESGKETALLQTGRLGRSSKSSSLLGSRVTAKPRLALQRTLSPEAAPSKHVSFSSLGVSPLLLSALSNMAIHAPTEIQQACIPPLLAGLLLLVTIPDNR
jgi:ATP-dependent RNA helicase DDX49/DBP8